MCVCILYQFICHVTLLHVTYVLPQWPAARHYRSIPTGQSPATPPALWWKNAEPRQPRCLKSHRTNDIHGIWCKQIARIGNVWVNSGNLVYPYCSAPKTFWEGVNRAQKQFQIQSQKVLGAVGYSIIHELLRGWIIRIPSGRPWHHYRWVDGGETIPVSLYFSSVKYHSKR